MRRGFVLKELCWRGALEEEGSCRGRRCSAEAAGRTGAQRCERKQEADKQDWEETGDERLARGVLDRPGGVRAAMQAGLLIVGGLVCSQYLEKRRGVGPGAGDPCCNPGLGARKRDERKGRNGHPHPRRSAPVLHPVSHIVP